VRKPLRGLLKKGPRSPRRTSQTKGLEGMPQSTIREPRYPKIASVPKHRKKKAQPEKKRQSKGGREV